MAIVRVEPPSDPDAIPEGKEVLVYSDAPDDLRAIWEIEDWCRASGLRREAEPQLQVAEQSGRKLRQGRCYRPTAADRQEFLVASAELLQRTRQMALTAPVSDDEE